MPRLSLWRPNKQNDYRFLDRIVSEQLTVGGTDLYIHKYAGISNQGPSNDATQPQYLEPNPTQIQDLLFLENRDRSYEPNIYRLRGHYSVQNLDFDLSQFGLFLNNDIIFVTVHYNDMIDIIGRKLMVGDVLELPHLLDYNPLNEKLPVALKRFMQVTDANYASEGFSQTWFPHLWRIKCEPLINSQEFSDILDQPVQQDNYLGNFDPMKTYPPGYTVTYGGTVYQSITDVPAGITPPNATYWSVVPDGSLADILSTYNRNISINDANLREAERLLPKSGYDNSNLYVVPTYGEYEENHVLSKHPNEPSPPINILIEESNTQPTVTGNVVMVRDPRYRSPSAGIKISKDALQSIWDMTVDADGLSDKIDKFVAASLSIIEVSPDKTESGSGAVETTKMLAIESLGTSYGPYGTADNTYATADQDPAQSGFTGDITQQMDYRADCDPRFQYIARSSPRSFGYLTGYLTGDGSAPDGYPVAAGIAFPQNPQVGDYFLRIDYMPQLLFRWDGVLWVRISNNVRTQTGFADATNQSQLNSFINNENKIYSNSDKTFIPEKQALSTILMPSPDILPPE